MCIFFLQILIKVEPYWNVNSFLSMIETGRRSIKVEPYWNVNLYWWSEFDTYKFIKVEPYWNVNSLFNILSTNTLDD